MNDGLHKGVPNYRVRWPVFPRHNVPITCSFVGGLHALDRQGKIELHLCTQSVPPSIRHIMQFDVEDMGTGITGSAALDVFDRSDLFCRETLDAVDVYFKRSYWPAAVKDLPRHLREKIRPAGITFGCFTPGARSLLTKSAVMAFVARSKRPGKFSVGESFLTLASDLEEIRCFLETSMWERANGESVVPRIVFQTRAWRELPGGDTGRSHVNKSRIALIRTLRDSFGCEETIGLLDTKSARDLAPDAILVRKVSRSAYANQLKTSLIAVNSAGLDGSAGFKVAESFAAGCALVSQPFQTQLPIPLVPDVHYLPYETPEECVAQCRYLLDNTEVAEKMRATNLQYYRDHIAPAAFAQNLLIRLFQSDRFLSANKAGINEASSCIS